MIDASTPLRFSLIVPVFNERDNVGPLLAEVAETLLPHGPGEVILVDDASTDDSVAQIRAWRESQAADWVRTLRFATNRGQSAAVLAGAQHARATYIVTLDGDLQNDPRDLVTMLDLLDQGDCDGVVGIRKNRRDTWVRRMSSRIANAVRNVITGDRVQDSGCGVKAFRRELFLCAPRFNGMHRFMATLVRYCGGRVREIEVAHRPRIAGEASYGIGNRALRGLKDCFAVRWMRSRVLQSDATED